MHFSYTNFIIILDVCTEAAGPPLRYRRMQISTSLITSVLQNVTLPVFDKLFHLKYVEKFATTKPHEHIKLAIEKSHHRKLNSHTLAPIISKTSYLNTQITHAATLMDLNQKTD